MSSFSAEQAAAMRGRTDQNAHGYSAERHAQATAEREAQAQRERDIEQQAAAHRDATAAAYALTPDGRAAVARRAAEQSNVAFYVGEASTAAARAEFGLRYGDTHDRLGGLRDSIRAKSAQLLSQSVDANGYGE